MKLASLSVRLYLFFISRSIAKTPLNSQLNSRPSYPTYVKSTDVRIPIITFATLWMFYKLSTSSYTLLGLCLLYPY